VCARARVRARDSKNEAFY